MLDFIILIWWGGGRLPANW